MVCDESKVHGSCIRKSAVKLVLYQISQVIQVKTLPHTLPISSMASLFEREGWGMGVGGGEGRSF